MEAPRQPSDAPPLRLLQQRGAGSAEPIKRPRRPSDAPPLHLLLGSADAALAASAATQLEQAPPRVVKPPPRQECAVAAAAAPPRDPPFTSYGHHLFLRSGVRLPQVQYSAVKSPQPSRPGPFAQPKQRVVHNENQRGAARPSMPTAAEALDVTVAKAAAPTARIKAEAATGTVHIKAEGEATSRIKPAEVPEFGELDLATDRALVALNSRCALDMPYRRRDKVLIFLADCVCLKRHIKVSPDEIPLRRARTAIQMLGRLSFDLKSGIISTVLE